MRQRSWIAISVLGVSLLALGLLQTPLLHTWRGLAWDAWVRTIGSWFDIGPLKFENNVNSQLQKLRAENVRLRAQLLDYQRLRQQLGTPSFESFRTIPAAVVGRPLDIFHTHFTLNQGAQEGVITQAPVVSQGSILVGFISQLHDHSSVLELLLQPGPGLAVEIIDPQTQTSVGRGLLQGRHFSSLLLTTVPRDVQLAAGQTVITLAKEAMVPHGLTIGTLKEITTSQNEAYQEAALELPYDPNTLDAVTVIVPP